MHLKSVDRDVRRLVASNETCLHVQCTQNTLRGEGTTLLKRTPPYIGQSYMVVMGHQNKEIAESTIIYRQIKKRISWLSFSLNYMKQQKTLEEICMLFHSAMFRLLQLSTGRVDKKLAVMQHIKNNFDLYFLKKLATSCDHIEYKMSTLCLKKTIMNQFECYIQMEGLHSLTTLLN